MFNSEKVLIVDAGRYSTLTIKRDRVSMWYPLILSKSFHIYLKYLF